MRWKRRERETRKERDGLERWKRMREKKNSELLSTTPSSKFLLDDTFYSFHRSPLQYPLSGTISEAPWTSTVRETTTSVGESMREKRLRRRKSESHTL